MSNRNLKYNGSFAANGILFNETLRVLEILREDDVDENLAKEVKENKLLQINSEATRSRAIRDIKKRNKFAGKDFWVQFSNSTEKEQQLLFFYLCLKTYRILFDLHFNVTVKRFHVDHSLPEIFYYKMAVDELASENATIASWSETTLRKTLSNYRSLLKISGLLNGKTLAQPQMPETFWKQFTQKGEFWFVEACFQSIK